MPKTDNDGLVGVLDALEIVYTIIPFGDNPKILVECPNNATLDNGASPEPPKRRRGRPRKERPLDERGESTDEEQPRAAAF